MTTAKINNQFHYITLKIAFPEKRTLNVTRSHSGMRLSGTEATREALDFIDAWFKSRKGSTVGESMEHLRSVAANSLSMKDFIRGM